MEDTFEQDQAQQKTQIQHDSSSELENDDIPFIQFSYSDLKRATKNFIDEVVTEKSEGSLNLVYKGVLQSGSIVVIKSFKDTWINRDGFEKEARRVGQLKHKTIAKLIGFCCDGDERLLVAHFLPNDTLAKRLFHEENSTLDWSMRLRVAYCIAEALEYCTSTTAGFTSYRNLSAHTVLFDEDGDACLSCFGLMMENEDDQRTGSVNPESVAYKFGSVLLSLLTGHLEASSEEAFFLYGLAVQSMEPNYGHIPTFELLQMLKKQKQVDVSHCTTSSQHEEVASPVKRFPAKPATKVGFGPDMHGDLRIWTRENECGIWVWPGYAR